MTTGIHIDNGLLYHICERCGNTVSIGGDGAAALAKHQQFSCAFDSQGRDRFQGQVLDKLDAILAVVSRK